MPLPSTDVPAPVRRGLRIVPLAIAFILVAGAAVFAWSHYFAKGAAPETTVPAEQQAQTGGTPNRGAYNAEDFTEPDSK
jgi:flagellar basal body-associated protein FliL